MKLMRSGSTWAALFVLAMVQGCLTPPTSDPIQSVASVSKPARPDWAVLLKDSQTNSKIIPATAVVPEDKPAELPDKNAARAFTRETALDYALKHNPALAVFREARGMAAAGVVLARIYPFNPIFQTHNLYANGPPSSGITFHMYTENYAVLPLELNGQGRERMASAAATATRTEWEIAGQEIATAIAALRAYDTVLYREQKLRVLEETVALSDEVLKQTRRLVDAGRLGAADALFAGTESDAARAQIGQGRTALAVARADLQRQIGTLDDQIDVTGELESPLPAFDEKVVIPYALKHRPEIRARVAAVEEAEAQLRLQIADRFGNLSIGPRADYSETRVNYLGVVVAGFIPVLNIRQGEIAQRRAAVARAQVDMRGTEVVVKQSVDAAMNRLTEARKWASQYSEEVLPNLKKARKDIEKLFAQNEQGVDILRVVGVQRTLLRSEDAYLDARFEVSQALLDLAAAVGEPGLAIGLCNLSGEENPQCCPPLSTSGQCDVSRWIKNRRP